MKKVLSLMCAFLMLGTLAACGNGSGSVPPSVEPTAPPSVQPSEEQPADPSMPTQEESTAPEQGSKVLVAYFSATGNTGGVAEMISTHLSAGTYEIIPTEPYTSADLDYGDSSSRSSLELDDPSARPAINGSVEGLESYDVIFLGYPIWWGEAPRIINTFLESYDFSGKTIVPFCTSASSGMGSSARNLESLTPGAKWLDGQRFGEHPSDSDVTGWVDGLALAG